MKQQKHRARTNGAPRPKPAKFFESVWNSYRKHFVHPEAGPDQLSETRRAYYAGADAAFMLVITALGQLGAKEDACGFLLQLSKELAEFIAQDKRGKM